jgi:hypothetical protein
MSRVRLPLCSWASARLPASDVAAPGTQLFMVLGFELSLGLAGLYYLNPTLSPFCFGYF